MPSGARRRSKKPKKPREPGKKRWYYIRDILQERRREGKIEYLVDWEDDEETGEQYSPTWTISENVTSKAIFHWRKKQKEIAARDEEPVSQGDPGQEAGDSRSSHAPPADTPNRSQAIQQPRRRKRVQREHIAEVNSDSEIEAFEDDAPRSSSKSRRSESLSLSSSEVDTDAASEILEAPSNFFVAIISKVEFDATEYLSVSASQDSSSLGSQALSALEDEDNQVILAKNLSQRTIPDSQEYSAFDSQDSQLFASTDLQNTYKGDISSGCEISDSQKQSSLGTSQSKKTGFQANLVGKSEQPFHPASQQSPLGPEHSHSSQDRQEDLDFSEPVFLTQYFPSESQHPVIPNTLSAIPEVQSQVPHAETAARPRSSSQDSASLDAQAAAQLAQEQYSVPASFSDTTIPSHQVDNLHGQDTAAHSPSTSARSPQESRFGTPVFVTQINFDFDVPSSSEAPLTQEEKFAGESSESNQGAFLTAVQVVSQKEGLVTIRDSQSDSNNTQHAQRVFPLPHISESQIDNGSSTEEDIVPDTIRRQPQRRCLSVNSLASASTSSGRAPTATSASHLFATSRPNASGSQEESFRSCVERGSLPPTSTEPVPVVQACRIASLPPNMASASGEPMSAAEELMRLQQSIMDEDDDEELYSGPGENQGQPSEVSGQEAETMDSHEFSMPMENPSMQIQSQLPISTDWNLEGATTSAELPVHSSSSVEPVVGGPVGQPPQTANMGDIFTGGLMAPEPVQQLPITISPSAISRSLEPDEGLATLHQQDLPLNILPAEDTATAKSTASSPDVEEQYPSGPPTAMDQSEYLVTVSFPANIRPLYLSTLSVYKNEIEKFSLICRNGEELPDQKLVDSIGRLLDQLRDICDLPASLDGASIDALSAEDLRKHAMGSNSKHFFVGRFLERLQTSHKKILIIVRDLSIMGYLEAVIGTNDMAYSLKGLHELESQDEHSLQIVLLHTEQTLVDDLSDFDVVIGFDGGIMRTDMVAQWARMKGRKPMLIRLMTTYSIEHIELFLPDHMDELERKNALIIALYQSRGLIGNDDQGEMIDGLTAHFANQVIDPEPNFGWEPEPIPTAVLDFYSDSQEESQMPPTAEDLTRRKRKADDGLREVTKRLRVSPPPGQTGSNVDEIVHGHLNPHPSHVHVRTTQDHLDSLSNKISELEFQLGEKTALEHNLRKQLTNVSKRVKSHERTTNQIHEKLMSAIEERSKYEAEQKEAKQNEQKALKKCQVWQSKTENLGQELKKKTATLQQALVDAGTVAADVFKEKTDELEKSLEKISELEKKLESRDNELEYARDVYQTANRANSELSNENKMLKAQVAEFHKQAAGSLAQIQNTNVNEQVKEMRKQIVETQAIIKDREKELTRVEKELRTLKNGRRETRQQSVPRSPRLGMMSPRAPRAAGGSASRGTSPVPYDSSGSTPVPGMQFLPSNNHRFNHLRE